MNQWKKRTFLCLLLLITVLLLAACGEGNPYAVNNSENYTVSVRFDANGGSFSSTNIPVITDSFNVSEMEPGSDGMVKIPLIEPDDENRSKSFSVSKNGYFLAGWYAQRTENADGTYTYAEPWDFANGRLPVDPNGEYSSDEPVLTLYAAWVPEYKIEFYDAATGEKLVNPATGKEVEPYCFAPTKVTEIQIPAWNEETGAMDMYEFPKLTGYTLESVSYDREGQQIIDTATITHPAVLDSTNATVTNGTLKLYTSWKEGEWYRITSAQQFADNFKVNGYYEILSDLDFKDVRWPTASMHGSFAGKIYGNGHTISNITLEQKDNSRNQTGLFGSLTEKAVITDVAFENVMLTVKGGARVAGASFGLLAGTVSADAQITSVTVANSQLLIDSHCYFAFDDYVIGLICGIGTVDVDASGVSCVATGDNPEKVNITVTDDVVTLEFVTE